VDGLNRAADLIEEAFGMHQVLPTEQRVRHTDRDFNCDEAYRQAARADSGSPEQEFSVADERAHTFFK